MRALLVTISLSGALALSSVSPARAERPADAAAAQALFERGRAAAQRGDLQEACATFAESQRLDPGAGTLMNWAMCEARQQKLASAWQHFNEASALLKPGDDRNAFVHAQLRQLSPRLPRLTLRLAGDVPAGTRVLRGGTELGAASLGVPLPMDPGAVELLVVSPGRKPRRALVELHEAEQLDVRLDAGEALPSPPRVVARDQPHSLQRDLGLSFVALGSLGVGLGLASGALVVQRKATADDHCPANRCDEVGLHAVESGQRWLVVNTVAWSVGAAALLGGAALLFIAPDKKRTASLQALPGGAAFVYAEHY